MGLTIHYKLQSGARTTRKARELVARLRGRALDLPFERVDDIVELSADECDFERRNRDDPLRWLLIQAGQYVELPLGDGSSHGYRVSPIELVAFSTWPGEGSEEANFGLCRYPAYVEVEDFCRPYRTRRLPTKLGQGWHWSSFCKTQYASNEQYGGVPHFLRCHLSVVRVLDFAQQLGILENVVDEGDFWLRRDVAALAEEVGAWDKMVAQAVGRWKDLLGCAYEAVAREFPDAGQQAESRKPQ